MALKTTPINIALLALLAPSLSNTALAADTQADTLPGTTLKTVNVSATATADTTEGTGAYTTSAMNTATRMDMSVHETPQSVSVVTRTQMNDFNMTSINDVLKSATGITVEEIETDRTYYTARGFEISNFQMDGIGQPLHWSIMNGDVDTAMYDRVEVVRGASGLMSGAGNPSATINRVRKRPTADLQISVEASAGSWNDNRLDADVAGAMSDTVRGRLVTAYEDKDSYIDDYGHSKGIIYGVIEADLTDSTLFTVGMNQQANDADSPMWGALPMYFSDGTQTDYDVSDSTSADWSYWDSTTNETFVELQQQLAENWQLRTIYTHNTINDDSELFYVYGAPDPVTHVGTNGWASKYTMDGNSDLLDVYVEGKFSLWGRQHDVVTGISVAKSDVDEVSLYDNTNGFPVIGDFRLWEGNAPVPNFVDGRTGSDFTDRQQAVYAATRIRATDNFAIISGARVVNWNSEGDSYGEVADMEENNKVIPYAGLVYDVSRTVALYTGYNETFMPQSELDINSQRLQPASGDSTELGVKLLMLDGNANATAALFDAHHENLADWAGQTPAGKNYYAGNDFHSQGVELELAGRLAQGVEATMGYTFLDVEDNNGNAARTYIPQHLLKLASSYKLPVEADIKLGAKANWQSRIKNSDLNYATGTIRQDSYIIVDMFASYAINKHVKTALNLNNLTDEKYIASLNWDQGFYGAPRNVNASVTWEY